MLAGSGDELIAFPEPLVVWYEVSGSKSISSLDTFQNDKSVVDRQNCQSGRVRKGTLAQFLAGNRAELGLPCVRFYTSRTHSRLDTVLRALQAVTESNARDLYEIGNHSFVWWAIHSVHANLSLETLQVEMETRADDFELAKSVSSPVLNIFASTVVYVQQGRTVYQGMRLIKYLATLKRVEEKRLNLIFGSDFEI